MTPLGGSLGGPLRGKVALITGSGSGMGQAHAVLMAERGAEVVVHDLNAEGAQETAERVRAVGGKPLVFAEDVTDIRAMAAVVRQVEAELGRLDILVNNAGIGQHRAIEEITEADFDRMFDVHVKGTFFTTQAVVPGMKQRRYGKIVNISSIWGMVGAATASHYCAAKAALLGFTKAWAKELAPYNIHVNAVAPGGVLTPMPIKVQGMEKIREKEKKVPLGRWATPEEIAYTVAFLASPEADFITGQVVSPNGGETI
jgi:3-oxoacyl-[acyl-carrier protein] reductase